MAVWWEKFIIFVKHEFGSEMAYPFNWSHLHPFTCCALSKCKNCSLVFGQIFPWQNHRDWKGPVRISRPTPVLKEIPKSKLHRKVSACIVLSSQVSVSLQQLNILSRHNVICLIFLVIGWTFDREHIIGMNLLVRTKDYYFSCREKFWMKEILSKKVA